MPRKKAIVEQEIILNVNTDELKSSSSGDLEQPFNHLSAEVDALKDEIIDTPKTVEYVAPSLKEQIQKLIDEAPNLSVVQHNPWTYTEWLAKLNGAVLRA
jgi:hypothetical protein